eukprot:gene11350-4518_t
MTHSQKFHILMIIMTVCVIETLQVELKDKVSEAIHSSDFVALQKLIINGLNINQQFNYPVGCVRTKKFNSFQVRKLKNLFKTKTKKACKINDFWTLNLI